MSYFLSKPPLRYPRLYNLLYKLDISLQGRKREASEATMEPQHWQPTTQVTSDPRHILEQSLWTHSQAAHTVIGTGDVFVNIAPKVRQNLVPKLVPTRAVVKLNLTF